MRRSNWWNLSWYVTFASVLAIVGATNGRAAESGLAKKVLEATGINGGIVVVVGGDGRLAMELGADDRLIVQGLATDPKAVETARDRVRSQKRYGRISIDRFDGKRLPYADNFVNLVVSEDLGDVSLEEVTRVLCPGGVAYVKQDRTWRRTEKPSPAEIDEWTHWLHGPDGNAVAADTRVGPPRHLQWVEGPIWLKHHNATINFSAMVSAGGRLFYVLDETPIGVLGMPERWSLVARDAFNGTLLWKRRIEPYGWKSWVGPSNSNSRFDQPSDLPRQLVAIGDRVYVPLGTDAAISELDAVTGKTLREYPGTARVSEVLYHQGKLIVSQHVPNPEADTPKPPAKKGSGKKARGQKVPGAASVERGVADKRIVVLEPKTGKVVWEKNGLHGVVTKTSVLKKYTNQYLTADGNQLFYIDPTSIVCVDLATGEECWRSPRFEKGPRIAGYGHYYIPNSCTLVAHDDVLLFAQTEGYSKVPWYDPMRTKIVAISRKDGKEVWRRECGSWGYFAPPDVFVVDGLVWLHEAKPFGMMALDVATGDVKKRFATDKAMESGHHHRCYRNKATSNYILTSRRGVEYIEMASERNLLHHWIRGACRYGILPCNGLLYAPPDPCMCYATAKMNGMFALAASRDAGAVADVKRLDRGPAFGRKTKSQPDAAPWPTYRHDSARSGSTNAEVPAELSALWKTKLGGQLSSVTVADGKIFVARVDAHEVVALDQASGKPAWTFTAGGRVDTPPTIDGGRALFGAADGSVYCVDAANGELLWRFLAAASDTRVAAFGQIESAQPVHGSVLVRDGVAYVAAGRSSFLDGGIRLYALDPATGKVLGSRTVFTPDPSTGEAPYSRTLRYDMMTESSGAISDILVADGPLIYMRHTKIDPKDLARVFEKSPEEIARFNAAKQTGKVLDFGPQVASTAGLLDDSWFNQTFWSYRNASHCRLLVCDERFTYGLKAFGGNASRHARGKFTPGSSKYQLFADDHSTKKRAWSVEMPLRVVAMAATRDHLFAAGTPNERDTADPWAAFDGRKGARLRVLSKTDGETLAETTLDAVPTWDGMAAAPGRLYLTTKDGTVHCLGKP